MYYTSSYLYSSSPDYETGFDIWAISPDGTKKWYTNSFYKPNNNLNFWSANSLLSFGGPRNDVLLAATKEKPRTLDYILLLYLKNIVLGSTIRPTASNSFNYQIGNLGIYFVEGLMNDPVNSFLAYLFTTDK